MTEAVQFLSNTPRYALPLLFPGQAQKEFFVNSALGLCDALLHPSVEGEVDSPPATASDGSCWLVSEAPTGAFAGWAAQIAIHESGTWQFLAPRDGMRVFDKTALQFLLFVGTWRREAPIDLPTGGEVVDTQAREAIAALLGSLKNQGIFPEN